MAVGASDQSPHKRTARIRLRLRIYNIKQKVIYQMYYIQIIDSPFWILMIELSIFCYP